MFTNEELNYEMLLGAYKKLKSYYYYNKNFWFMREKIAVFENDSDLMEYTLNYLAKVLREPMKYQNDINRWIESIDYYVLPKTFVEDKTFEERFVSSTIYNKSVAKVNFFINMPIELHLLETVWALYIAKIVHNLHIVQDCSYGNSVDDKVLFDDSEMDIEKAINFSKNKFFKIYFPQYCKWKNSAIQTIEDNKKDKSMVLISLDIKSFYYSVRWKFNKLETIIEDKRLEDLKQLTNIMEKIFCNYTQKLAVVRNLGQNISMNESVLPIGLFSSMILANIYLSAFDNQMLENSKILYYGRYVDDMILVMNVSQEKVDLDDAGIKKILTIDNHILVMKDEKNYAIENYEDLIIQRDKMKMILFECGKSEGLIANLKKTKIIPSQVNIVPSNDIQLQDFEEMAYVIHNFSNETKIRDLGQIEVDRFKLGMYMSGIVRNSRYKLTYMSTKEEKKQRQNEKDKLVKFFVGSKALEYNSNWINALYYFLLNSTSEKRYWNKFEEEVRYAIRKLTIKHLDSIKKGKERIIKSKMKKNLDLQFDICVATALAINPKFSKKEKREILDLCYKIRNANLFNHYLVSFPLINYSDNMQMNIDLSNIDLDRLESEDLNIHKSRKMKLSPRFINFDELFQFAFVRDIANGNAKIMSENMINNIRDTFLKVNCINMKWAKPLCISIEGEEDSEYNLQKINLYNKERELNNIRIAVANIKLNIDDCCMGLNDIEVARNRKNFLDFLNEAYTDEKNKVDYLVFPEFYLPLSWMQDILAFSRKTGITVISGIQYVTKGHLAHNLIGVFARAKSGKYNAACVIVREKNNYAPLEKKILATKGYKTVDKTKPIYTYFNDGGVRFGTFLCYEFTDICARSLFKNKADIIFTPENNNDTTYFSNIIDTMTRDIHAFMVQSNTSIYGDSRISGPYSRDYRNIVQIKGGDNDNLIIGTINLKEVKRYREEEREKMESELEEIFAMNKLEKKNKYEELKGSHSLKIAKCSARTIF